MNYIVLHRTNGADAPSRGRYYALSWALALTGGWVVERTWGPLRAHQRQQKSNFTDNQAATLDFVAYHLRRRFRHGYTVQEASPEGHRLAERIRKKENQR